MFNRDHSVLSFTLCIFSSPLPSPVSWTRTTQSLPAMENPSTFQCFWIRSPSSYVVLSSIFSIIIVITCFWHFLVHWCRVTVSETDRKHEERGCFQTDKWVKLLLKLKWGQCVILITYHLNLGAFIVLQVLFDYFYFFFKASEHSL